MRITIKLLLLEFALVLCSFVGNAQLIYSNSFNGDTVTVNGAAPTLANSLLGGSSDATWLCTTTNGANATVYANGGIDVNPGCALLPFTPQPGCVYFMTASLTLPPGMPNWVAMGFTQFATQTNNATGNYCRFTDNPPAGYAWLGIRANTAQGVYAGRGTGSSMGNSTVIPAGTTNITIVLNTTGPQWTVSAYLGGVISGTTVAGGTQMGTNFTYSANPPIAYAGIGQTSFAGQSVSGIQWNYWTLSVAQAPAVTTGYWVAPAATGAGDGSSPLSAAYYLNSSFWTGVSNQLQSANVNVNFVSGAYNAGSLTLTDVGNPVHQLALAAVTPHGAVFSPSANILQLYGCQNFEISGLVFNGPSPDWGIYCIPNGLDPCRNIEITNCWFLNLTNAYYAAIGLLNGTRDIEVCDCDFTNITAGDHQHMIYAPHDIEDVVVSNCVFQDCLADYVRFRDDSEYCVVDHCTFLSTMSASAWPFVSAELYNETNSDSAGDEFFGTHFQISNNSFIYQAGGGPGPYSALHFSDTGWSPQSYDCDLTSSQASQLSSGSTSFQQSFLQTNMGIIASGIKMFGNTYSGTSYHMDYAYVWDGSAPWNNWQGTIGLNNVPDSSGALMGPTPALRNGDFDKQGLLLTAVSQGLKDDECLFRDWFCSPKYTDILRTQGFDGTTNALLFDQTESQCVYQWITPPGPAWTMDCLFAIGPNFTGTGTKFKVDIFHNDIAGSKVSVGVNDQGQFGIYDNGGNFITLPGLGTVSFSTGNVYRLRIVGNYAASTPYVNIYTSNANSQSLSHQSPGLTDWVNGTPASGQSSPETIAFYNYTAPVIVDQIAIASRLAGQPPVITSAFMNNGQFILSGTNGFPGDNYFLLSSTNLTSGAWTIEATNSFDANGAFSVTNVAPPGSAPEFYRLQLQ